MILVAGLGVAGLVGIAAAFYFSIRTHGSGYKRNARGHSAGTGRTRSDRRQVSGAAPNDEWRENAGQDANFGETGNPGLISGPAPARGGRRTLAEAGQAPQDAPTVATPAFVTGSMPEASLDDMPAEAWQGSDDPAQPLGAFAPDAPRSGRRAAARLARASAADDDADASPAKATSSRRRKGWRKGADIDEEMWPTESFGGVSDDQFWDDLASDKPLATTARTAQQGKPPVAADTPTDKRSGRPPGSAQKGAQGGAWGNARRAGHAGAYPDSRPADRNAIQPAQVAAPPAPMATQPVPMATPPVAGTTQPVPTAPGQGRQYPRTDSQPMRPATQPTQPSETSGRRYAGASSAATEDPLTSAAFSLRSSGPVDGRSNQPSSGPHDLVSREHYAAVISQETQTFSANDAEAASGGHPGGVPPFRQPPSGGSRAIEPRHRSETPRPSGGWYRSSDTAAAEAYGTGPADAYTGTAAYPYPGPPLSAPIPADEPRRPNGGGTHARQYGGSGNHAPRPAQSSGHRRPYDPRDDYRRLVTK